MRLWSVEDISKLEKAIQTSSDKSLGVIKSLLEDCKSLDFMASLKFKQIGFDPLDSKRPLNFIEQLNQSFTCLVSLKGVEYLLKHHKESAPFILNHGTRPGPDIISEDKSIAAEVFAATNPKSNQKLKKDIEKVSKESARYKYVFYYSPIDNNGSFEIDGITIVPIDKLISEVKGAD